MTNDGWATNYTVEIEHMINATLDDEFDVVNASSTLRRTDRKLVDAFHSSIAPPFNVSNLIPENEYKILITTTLNDKVSNSSNSFFFIADKEPEVSYSVCPLLKLEGTTRKGCKGRML